MGRLRLGLADDLGATCSALFTISSTRSAAASTTRLSSDPELAGAAWPTGLAIGSVSSEPAAVCCERLKMATSPQNQRVARRFYSRAVKLELRDLARPVPGTECIGCHRSRTGHAWASASVTIARARGALAQRNHSEAQAAQGADWLQPPAQERGLGELRADPARAAWLIVLAVVITTGAAVLYVATAIKTYESEADMLVTPVPPQSDLLISLGLISQSADPVREIETVARLTATNEVAAKAQKRLDGIPEADGTAQALLGHVSAQPVADCEHRRGHRERLDSPRPPRRSRTRSSTRRSPTEPLSFTTASQPRSRGSTPSSRGTRRTARSLESQLSQLKRLGSSPDPTVQAATTAVPPTSQSSPKPALSIAGGLLVGLVLGIGGAFAYQALDPRLSREEQLRARFRLPILARIPKESRAQRNAPISPESLSPGALEAYRALRASLGPGRAATAAHARY